VGLAVMGTSYTHPPKTKQQTAAMIPKVSLGSINLTLFMRCLPFIGKAKSTWNGFPVLWQKTIPPASQNPTFNGIVSNS
jgi:hypothetical protein